MNSRRDWLRNALLVGAAAVAPGADLPSRRDLVPPERRPRVAALVNAASFVAPGSPGAWLAIFGERLAPPGVNRIWRPEEIVGGRFPTRFDGIQVWIGGRLCAIYYASEGQLNVQAPSLPMSGPVAVEVANGYGTSEPAVFPFDTWAPGLFRFSANGGSYAAAVHADGTAVGPPGLFGPATPARPATPGEIVLLFGTGYGPTSPSVPSGQIFTGSAPLVDESTVRVRLGQTPADVLFAGLTAAGLDQINIRVPSLPAGDYSVETEVRGVLSPAGVLLRVTG